MKQALSAKNSAEKLSLLSSLLDLTSLEGSDTSQKIKGLCRKALTAAEKFPVLQPVASVCVYPVFARTARVELAGSGIAVGVAAGGFPHGQSPLSVKLSEIRYALDEGADEIDFVFSRGKFYEGEHNYVSDEIAAAKSCCGKHILKVILETGELGTEKNILQAAELALAAGADFIKTSTGKIPAGASPEAAGYLGKAVFSYFQTTNRRRGIKISGSVSDIETANRYLVLIEGKAGAEWLNKNHLRFGASRLFDAILLAAGSKYIFPDK